MIERGGIHAMKAKGRAAESVVADVKISAAGPARLADLSDTRFGAKRTVSDPFPPHLCVAPKFNYLLTLQIKARW